MHNASIRQAVLTTPILLGVIAPLQAAEDPEIQVETYTYKRVGDLEIKAEVHRPDDGVVRPVVVWIHGGALIMGHRQGISNRVRQYCRRSGHVLVSLDYRLAPESKLPEIISDIEDAFRWIRERGPELFAADPNKLAVMGGSAGGYLTLTAGFRVQPRPQVLLAFWGYGDLIGDWYSQPSPHPRHHRSQLSEEEAWQQVNGPPISDSRQRRGNGSAFYQFCRQRGVWPAAVSTWNPYTEPERFYPYMPVQNVTPDYPPTFLIHGTEDTDVPHEQSVMMAKQLAKHGVMHRLVSVAGGEHGLGGGAEEEIEQAYRDGFAFIERHLNAE